MQKKNRAMAGLPSETSQLGEASCQVVPDICTVFAGLIGISSQA